MRMITRLIDLEFFVTAVMVPIILGMYVDSKRTIFGVLNPDTLSNQNGDFDETWYTMNGNGMIL